MLKKLTLATVLALGATALAGASALPAAAENIRSARALERGGIHVDAHRRHQGSVRVAQHVPDRRFLRAVRHGRIVCFENYRHRHGHWTARRGYRFYRAHGRRLGYRAVRRLVRRGHRHAIRCFRNV